MNPALKQRVAQIRRRWWLVALCCAAAILSAIPTWNAPAKYTATSTLMLSSSQHLDDTTLVVGYSTLFNEPATIGRLQHKLNIPADVEFVGRTVASSPILAITATTTDPSLAQDSSQRMAEAFRDDINAVQKSAYESAIRKNQKQLDTLLARPVPPDGVQDPLIAIMTQRLDTLRSELTSQLQDLQLRGGVVEAESQRVFELAARIIGGLLLGIVAALALAKVSTRLDSSSDVLEKTGIEPLVEVPPGGSAERDRERKQRVRALAGIVSMQDLPKSSVVAFTDCRGSREARELADAVAMASAEKGYQTVLVHADNGGWQHSTGAGFNDVIVYSELAETVLKDGPVDRLKIMTSGTVVTDRYALISRERMTALVDELRVNADIIIVAAPPIEDTVDSQQICAAADFTVLVIGRRASRSRDVTSAVDALSDARAILLGTVLADETRRRPAAPERVHGSHA